ncbi:HNH endonuclease signature motif containing protein [Janibacter melonis]|uniref:HNH endonuclease signature motif containing protein n=1 Tax=Janibacter melonis TaxID=262209 RepID=UPI002095825D|nr:HNH endonuclease signature motif containing protein [Janibacter melonis]
MHAGLDRLEADLDALGRASGVTAREMGEVMRELTRLLNRTQALTDKGAAVAASIDVAGRTGARSTGQWLAQVTSSDPRAGYRQAQRAEGAGLAAVTSGGSGAKGPGRWGSGCRVRGAGVGTAGEGWRAKGGRAEPRGPEVSLTGRAQLAGDLSREQVEVIQTSLSALPDGLAPETVLGCERELIELAQGHGPRDLRRLAARVLDQVGQPVEVVDAHEEHQVRSAEDLAWERASFWIRDNDDGTMHGQFTVPTLAGQTLKKILDAMSSPRRRGAAGPDGSTGAGDETSPGSGLSGAGASGASPSGAGAPGASASGAGVPLPAWCDPGLSPRDRQVARQQRQGQDLAVLLGHLPTDHLHEKTAATVVVTTRLSDLVGETLRVGSTDTGDTLSPGEVRRVACQAGIVPAVLDGDSVPIDLGRQTRFYSSTQRVALATIYDTCAARGCDIPFAWTEVHHAHPWKLGGRTDLSNGIPLCGRHHRMLDRGFEHRVLREGSRVVVELARRRT